VGKRSRSRYIYLFQRIRDEKLEKPKGSGREARKEEKKAVKLVSIKSDSDNLDRSPQDPTTGNILDDVDGAPGRGAGRPCLS
jgi:hypothetical protein